MFILRYAARLIELEPLADYIAITLPQAWDFDFDPAKLRQHLA